jgi:RNA polymerase sigma-70 factor (ECF subfamily)
MNGSLTIGAEDGANWARLRSGDDGAWELVYEAYADPLYRALRSWAPYVGAEEIEELLAETFARVFASREQIATRQQLEGWLFKIARNLAVDGIRKRGRTPQALRLDMLNSAARDMVMEWAHGRAPVGNTDDSELSALVDQVLAELPLRQQQVLLEKYRDGRSLKEIARKLGLGIEAASALLYRGRMAFRERFARRVGRELSHDVRR